MSLIKVKSRGTVNITGRKNLIINGAMQVQQRYAAGTATQAVSNTIAGPDRFKFFLAGGGAYTCLLYTSDAADE